MRTRTQGHEDKKGAKEPGLGNRQTGKRGNFVKKIIYICKFYELCSIRGRVSWWAGGQVGGSGSHMSACLM